MPLMPTLAHAAGHAHAIAPYYLANRPASVQANPVILMFSIFGLLGGTMLAIETIRRILDQARDEPHPWRHPVSAYRMIVGLTATAVLLYIGPDAVSFMTWPDVSPETRYRIALANRILDFAALGPLTCAWLLGIYAQPTMGYQLSREPIPIHLWPNWRELRRPLWIGLLLLLASAGLSLGR